MFSVKMKVWCNLKAKKCENWTRIEPPVLISCITKGFGSQQVQCGIEHTKFSPVYIYDFIADPHKEIVISLKSRFKYLISINQGFLKKAKTDNLEKIDCKSIKLHVLVIYCMDTFKA